MIAEFLPAVAVGLFLGPLLDRISRRGLMIVSDLVRAAVFCTLPFANTAGQIVALAGIAGLATGFFRPAVYAGLPNLVDEQELARANSLIQTSENVSWTVAPIIGGALVAASGPELAYWLNGASFVVSALLLLRLPADKLQGALAVSRGHLRDLKDGFARVLRTRALLTVLVVWTIVLGCRRFDADRAGVPRKGSRSMPVTSATGSSSAASGSGSPSGASERERGVERPVGRQRLLRRASCCSQSALQLRPSRRTCGSPCPASCSPGSATVSRSSATHSSCSAARPTRSAVASSP